MYLHYFFRAAHRYILQENDPTGSPTGRVAQIFRTRGSHSPERWLILGQIIQVTARFQNKDDKQVINNIINTAISVL
ncbi:MAG: hypothetical protein C4554_04500 [Dethiobacter sp.]|nr:MAG: hypothetical protein C4554_04500 [Dethiobacter sp.]